jgi:hypothetical protein
MSASLQDQKLTELNFKVGVYKEKTQLDATSYWTDADTIRFRFGRPELMGGWQRVIDSSQDGKIFGVPRLLDTLRNRLGQAAAFIATNAGAFSSELSTFYNITPRVTTVASSNILSTTAGSTNVVVSVSAHGLTNGTLVEVVSAGTTIGGNILINSPTSTTATFQASVIDSNSFAINVGTTAAATSAGTGGSVTLGFNYNAGTSSTQLQGGWGTGAWGGNFGWNQSLASFPAPLRLWSADLWGSDIMAIPSKGPLMYWNTSAGITDRMTSSRRRPPSIKLCASPPKPGTFSCTARTMSAVPTTRSSSGGVPKKTSRIGRPPTSTMRATIRCPAVAPKSGPSIASVTRPLS